jgi:hypothetical protein
MSVAYSRKEVFEESIGGIPNPEDRLLCFGAISKRSQGLKMQCREVDGINGSTAGESGDSHLISVEIQEESCRLSHFMIWNMKPKKTYSDGLQQILRVIYLD